MPAAHPASFRLYLTERFTSLLPTLGAFHFIEGDAPDLAAELARINGLIARHPIDVTFAGIGENAHLAFNDPPADFNTTTPYIVVTLDEACRRQQVGEGWFRNLDDVPTRAVSMSIQQMLKADELIVVVPDARKAQAVRAALQDPISPAVPATALRQHPNVTLYLDEAAASLL